MKTFLTINTNKLPPVRVLPRRWWSFCEWKNARRLEYLCNAYWPERRASIRTLIVDGHWVWYG